MIIALRPDYVSEHWEEVSMYVKEAIPPIGINTGASMNIVLERILSGKIICWLLVNTQKIIEGFLLTCINEDFCTGAKTVLLYALAGDFSRESWIDGFFTIHTYAKGLGCKYIAAYSTNPTIINIAKSFNWNTDTKYIYLEV